MKLRIAKKINKNKQTLKYNKGQVKSAEQRLERYVGKEKK